MNRQILITKRDSLFLPRNGKRGALTVYFKEYSNLSATVQIAMADGPEEWSLMWNDISGTTVTERFARNAVSMLVARLCCGKRMIKDWKGFSEQMINEENLNRVVLFGDSTYLQGTSRHFMNAKAFASLDDGEELTGEMREFAESVYGERWRHHVPSRLSDEALLLKEIVIATQTALNAGDGED